MAKDGWFVEENDLIASAQPSGGDWFVEPEDIGIKQAPVQAPQQKQLTGGVKQFNDWLGQYDFVKDAVKAKSQQDELAKGNQEFADIFNKQRIPGLPMPEIGAQDALSHAKGIADTEGLLNFGDGLLNFVPGIAQQMAGVKPEDRRYFDMAGTFRRSNPMASYLAEESPEFYKQQSSTAEMAGPLPNLSFAKLFSKVPMMKPLGNAWLQAIEKGSGKAIVADTAATGAMLGLQGVPNKNLKEKKDITAQELATGAAVGAGLGALTGGVGVGLNKAINAGLNKIGGKAGNVSGIADDINPEYDMNAIAGEDVNLVDALAYMGLKESKNNALSSINDLVTKQQHDNYQELVLDKIAPEKFEPVKDFLKGVVTQEREIASREALQKKAQNALDIFQRRGTNELGKMKISRARELAAKESQKAKAQGALDIFQKRATKEVDRMDAARARELAQSKKTVQKFTKLFEKVEEANKKLFLSPDIDPVNDFLSRQRPITKGKKQTFAVEAQSNQDLEKRVNQAITDGDLKSAESINKEIAKRVRNESKEPDLEPVPDEQIAESEIELESTIQQIEWDMTYGNDRGNLGTKIDAAVANGLIDEETGMIATMFGEASHAQKANEALYENIGKTLLKRYGVDELDIDGVKFGKSAPKLQFTEDGQKEMEALSSSLPTKDGASATMPAHVRSTPNVAQSKLAPIDENAPDSVLTALAKVAVQKRPQLEKIRKELAGQLKDRYEQLPEKPILNYPINEEHSLGIEYVNAHERRSWGETPEQQLAAEQEKTMLQAMLESGKAYMKEGINAKLSKTKLALFGGATTLTQFFAGQSAEAADMTTKALNNQNVFDAMSMVQSPEMAAAATLLALHAGKLDSKVSQAVDKFINSPESKGFFAANWLWHDTQDRIELLGKIVGDKNLAKARIEATAKINQLYFGKELGDPEVAARALYELRSGEVLPMDALKGAGAFKELSSKQREAVIKARAYQAQLSSIHRKFVETVDIYKKNLNDALMVAPHLKNEINTKLKTINRLEASLRFEESKIGRPDRTHHVDKVTNVLASGFGEFQFGTRNYAFQIMNLLSDSGILGASYTGAKNYFNAVKDLRMDGDLRKLFKNSNLAGQRKQDNATTLAEGALYKAGRALGKINPGRLLPELDGEKINADHFALAQAYKYFETNQKAIHQSGFKGSHKDFAKALFSNSKVLDGVVMQDAWNDISVGLWRSHGVDPLGINTNFLNEAPVGRMLSFFTKQPARTTRLMTHYIAKGEWRKLYTMFGFMTLAGGSAALPVELQFLGGVLAPEQMAEFEKRLDELEIYRRLNPHRTMTPKTEYGAFLWPIMGSINPVVSEARDLLDRKGQGTIGTLMKAIMEFTVQGRAENKTIEKLAESAAQYSPVKGLNLLIKANKARREIEEGSLNLFPENIYGGFEPSKKKVVTFNQLKRDNNAHLFNRMFMPGEERAKYQYQRDYQEGMFQGFGGRKSGNKKTFDFEKFLRGG